jgi:hypothetical protein
MDLKLVDGEPTLNGRRLELGKIRNSDERGHRLVVIQNPFGPSHGFIAVISQGGEADPRVIMLRLDDTRIYDV